MGKEVCMLASTWKKWPAKLKYATVQPKFDGFRLIVHFDDCGQRTYYCRDPKPVPWAANLGAIDAVLASLNLENCFLDGELIASNWNELASLVKTLPKNMTPEKLQRVKESVVFVVFDYVTDTEKIYRERLSDLRILSQRMFGPVQMVGGVYITRVSSTAEDMDRKVKGEYLLYLELGYEGAIVKDLDSTYKPGSRTGGWWKIKPKKTVDLTIVDMVEGEGKCKGMLGALVCDTARVGTGFTDEQRRDLWARREELIGKLVEVEFQDSPGVSETRHPSFKRIREDRL